MRRTFGAMGAAMAVALMGASFAPAAHNPYIQPKVPAVPKRKKQYKRRRISGFGYPSNGKRECARRMRQIAGGQLKPENRGVMQ